MVSSSPASPSRLHRQPAVDRGQVLVVVPTLGDRPQLLARTLDSISQAGPAFTVVVAQRPDRIARICGNAGVLLVEQTGRGLSAAINQAWSRFGELPYWTWIGDDDLLTVGSLERSVAYLAAHSEKSLVFGRCAWIDGDGNPLWVMAPGRYAAWTLGVGPNLLPQPGAVLRASAVRRVGMLDTSLRFAMDLDIFLRLAGKGRVGYLRDVQGCFRMHPDSTTTSGVRESWLEARRVQLLRTALPRWLWTVLSRVSWLIYPLVTKAMVRRDPESLKAVSCGTRQQDAS